MLLGVSGRYVRFSSTIPSFGPNSCTCLYLLCSGIHSGVVVDRRSSVTVPTSCGEANGGQDLELHSSAPESCLQWRAMRDSVTGSAVVAACGERPHHSDDEVEEEKANRSSCCDAGNSKHSGRHVGGGTSSPQRPRRRCLLWGGSLSPFELQYRAVQ